MRHFLATAAVGLLLMSPATAEPASFDLQAVRIDHGDLRVGEKAEVRVAVRNNGPGVARGVQVTLASEGRTWGVLHSRQDLGPRQEIVLTGTFTPPVDGAGHLTATVAPEDGNPGNNVLAEAVTVEAARRPDLQIQDLVVPKGLRAGDPVRIDLRVANEGEVPTGGARVELLVDGKPVGTWRMQKRLKPGNTENVRLSWTPDRDGSFTVVAVVDPDDAVAEADETNNRMEATADVAERRQPDLLAQELLPSGDLRQGKPSEILVRVANKGTAPAHSVALELKADGQVVAERTVRLDIAPGSARAIPLTWIPKTAGPLSLEVAIDPKGRYPESSRENNTIRGKGEVLAQAAADLQAVRIDAPDSLVVGRMARLEAVVRNEGDLPAFSCRVFLLVDGEPAAVGTSPSGLDPGAEVRVPLKWTPERTGSMKLEIEVETRASGADRSLADNKTEAQVEVVEPKERKAP